MEEAAVTAEAAAPAPVATAQHTSQRMMALTREVESAGQNGTELPGNASALPVRQGMPATTEVVSPSLLQHQLKSHTMSIKTLHESLGVVTSTVQDISSTNQMLHSRLRDLEGKLETAQSERQALQHDVVALSDRIVQQHVQYVTHHQHAANLIQALQQQVQEHHHHLAHFHQFNEQIYVQRGGPPPEGHPPPEAQPPKAAPQATPKANGKGGGAAKATKPKAAIKSVGFAS